MFECTERSRSEHNCISFCLEYFFDVFYRLFVCEYTFFVLLSALKSYTVNEASRLIKDMSSKSALDKFLSKFFFSYYIESDLHHKLV
jgi:hypothetical protein